ncbi:hypothetical protein DFH06DRAFT_1303917 [Mycena polygramma]|nr:hypothetical protein DFH06DRAFT_1303917 [Mycena polygramma]
MRIPFSLLLAVVLSLDAFAAPVANANVRDESALEVRKAKVAAKKAPVKAKVPVVKAKPLPKPKPPVKAVKPVAKPPVKAAKPVAKPPVKAVKPPVKAVKPAAKPPVKAAKPAAKPPVKAVKPVAKPPVKAAKPAAKPPVKAVKPVAVRTTFFISVILKPATKPAAKKVTAPAKKPATKAPIAKPATKPAAKPPVKPGPSRNILYLQLEYLIEKSQVAKGTTAPVKAAPAAKAPTSCAVRKKPAKAAVKARASDDTLGLDPRAKKQRKPITACGVAIRADNVAALCEKRASTFLFLNGELDKKALTRRVFTSDSEAEDTDDSEDEESDDSKDGNFSPSPEPETRSQCDHVVELQVLKKTLESTGGVCDTLKAMIASPNSGLTTDDIPKFMAPLVTAINSQNNLFFLDKKINQVKRDEVTASLKGQAAKPSISTALSSQRVAVNDYLTDTSVKQPSITLAKKLDTLAAAMLTNAETEGLANIKSCAGTTATADEAALKAAKTKLKTPPTVTSAWNDVLTHVAAQAKI